MNYGRPESSLIKQKLKTRTRKKIFGQPEPDFSSFFFSFEPEKSIERVTIFFLPRNDFFFRNARSLQNEFFEELCDAERTVERQKVGSESLEFEFECRRGWKISSWSVSWLLGFFLLMAAAFRSTYIFL